MRWFLFSLVFAASTASAQVWTEVYKTSKPSIPLLIMGGGYCSGSLIDKDLVLTAAHCVSRLRPVSVSWSDDLSAFESTKVVAMDRDSDLALLRLSKPNIRAALKVAPEASDPKPGDPVATIGHPSTRDTGWNAEYFFKKDEIYLISSGIISGMGEKDLVTDASFTPGNSGGPILNPKSEIVGVASRKRIGSTVGSIGFAPHSKSIRALLEKNKKDGDQTLPWWKASTDINLSLSYTTVSFKTKGVDYSLGLLGYRLGLDFWDRLRIEYSNSGNSTWRLTDWGMGWKFQILEESQHVWNLTPFLSYTMTDLNDEAAGIDFEDKGLGYGVDISTSRFPFSFRITGVRLPDENKAALQIHLPIF